MDRDVLDTGPNGYHGTNNGVSFVAGQVNNAGDFEASESDYISIGNVSELDFNGVTPISFSFWVNLESSVSNQTILSKRNHLSPFEGWEILIKSDGTLRFNIGSNNSTDKSEIETIPGISDSIFTFIVATYDGSQSPSGMNVFFNNVLQTKVTIANNFTGDSSNSANVSIGSRNDNGFFFDGLIDDVRIYNHVLTASERKRLFLWDGDKEVEINGIDYSLELFDWIIGRPSIYAGAWAETSIADPDDTIDQAIERYQEIKLYFQGTLRFTGLLVDIDPGDNTSHILTIYAKGYWDILLRSPINQTYTNQTWTQILTDIVNNNEYISDYNIGASKIEATTNLESKEYVGIRASAVVIEGCMAEDFMAIIDESKDLVFKSNTKDDTGIHLVYANGDIRRENFKRTGGDIITIALVRGKAGSPPNNPPIYGIFEDDELKSVYGSLPLEFNEPNLSTTQECLDWGEREIKRRNESPIRGFVETDINFALAEGSLLTLTIAHRNITAQAFYIVSAKHHYADQSTRLDLVYYSRTSADYINEILQSAIKASQYLTDKAAVATKAKRLTEPITVTSNIDVERRSYSGAVYGEFNYSERYYGQVSGAWTKPITNQPMKVTNLALEDFLRIIAQIATVPTILDSANAHIALGSGTTVVEYSDTTLENENFRLPVSAGHPFASADGELQLEVVIGDATTITATLSNCGVFNASSSGNMASAIVLSTSISKAADEEIRFTIRIKFTGALYLSTAGANLLRDFIAGFDISNFLDNSNSAIEIITTAPSTYREGMAATHPKFINATKDSVRYQTNIDTTDIDSEGLDGETFTIMDLYNKTGAGLGTKVIDGTVGATTFNVLQNIFAQIVLKLTR